MDPRQKLEQEVRRVLREMQDVLHAWNDQDAQHRWSRVTHEVMQAEADITKKIRELWPQDDRERV